MRQMGDGEGVCWAIAGGGDGGSAAKDNMMRTKGCSLCAANGGGFKALASNLSDADGVETHSLD